MLCINQLRKCPSPTPGQPRAFVQVLCSKGGAFLHPEATPWEFKRRGFKAVVGPACKVGCFIPSR